MKNVTELFGKQLCTLRNAAGLSQEELAFKASLSTNHLGQIERGQKSPTLEIVAKIATALNVPLIQLFNFESTPLNTDITISEKILNQLATFTPEQQQDIFRMIKILNHFQTK